MKKLLLVCSVSALFSVSGTALASDRAVATAWSGASDSIARLVNTPTLRAIAASISGSTMTAASIFVGRGQHALAKSSGAHVDAQDKEASALRARSARGRRAAEHAV
jgi:hypothetical protein